MGKKKVAQPGVAAEGREEGVPQAAARGNATKKAKKLTHGRIYINASYNNTVITATDMTGNVVAWASAGSLGFSGPKKATPFAASKIVAVIAEKVRPMGLEHVEVVVRGIGGGRDSGVRSLVNHGFEILSIKDATGIPHNGPRPAKVRRV